MSKIFLITAPSGAGKTTIAQELQKQGYWNEVISSTTRPMRDGEVDGKTYYFMEKSDFADSYQNGEFAEHVTYDGNDYGILKTEITRVLDLGKPVFIIVEYNGYLQLKELYPDAVGIFLWMTKEDCMANMLLRGDKFQSAMNRIEKYQDEMDKADSYDYVVKNIRGRLTETLSIFKGIIGQHHTQITINTDGIFFSTGVGIKNWNNNSQI